MHIHKPKPLHTVREFLSPSDVPACDRSHGEDPTSIYHAQMSKSARRIRFKARLLPPASAAKGSSWTFLTLPKTVSAKLPSRGMTTVEGTINGIPFRATLEPDGQKGHWLKVSRKLREAAGTDAGDVVTLEVALAGEEPEPKVPADLRKALTNAPKAHAVWSDITPIARRDWIHWIISAKRPETRARRIKNACAMLADGKRRVCCFDRSGFYSKSLSSPRAAIEIKTG
jgi:hypothetical protein